MSLVLEFDQKLLDLLPVAVYVCDAAGQIAQYNRAAVTLWGREPRIGDADERFCGALRLFHLDGRAMSHASTPMAEAFRTGQPQHNREAIIEHPDGARIVVLVNIDLIRDENGELRGAVNAFQDVTEKKHYESRLQSLAAIIDSSDDAIIGATLDGTVTSWNAGAEQIFGFTAAEMVGRPVSVLVPPGQKDEVPVNLDRIRRGERVEQYETIRLRKDGSRVELSLKISPIRDARGRLIGISKMARNITDHKDAKRNLMLYRQIFANSNDSIAIIAPDGRYLEQNAAHRLLTGYENAELDGQTPAIHLGQEVFLRLAKALEQNSLWRGEVVSRHKSGRMRDVDLSAFAVRDVHGRAICYVGMKRDISGRKQAEAALQASERRFRELVEQAPVVIQIFAPDGRAVLANAAWEELWGATRADMEGYNILHDPQLAAKGALPYAQRAFAGEAVAIPPTVYDPAEIGKEGRARWVEAFMYPVKDVTGGVHEVVLMLRDVTDRMEALMALKEADRRKDEFLATLAHELRNPLAPISHAIELMGMLLEDPVGLAELHTVMSGQIRQVVRLVDDLLDVSRISRGRITLRTERVELGRLIGAAVESVRPATDESRHQLELRPSPEPLWLEGDSARLVQVFSNLLTNAAKYTPAPGRIEVAWSREEREAVVRIRDNGIGIPGEQLERIWEMFAQVDQSLERSQMGLGIGLTLVRTLVTMHGGTVAVSSDGPGRGSEFAVRIPLATEEIPDDAPNGPDGPQLPDPRR